MSDFFSAYWPMVLIGSIGGIIAISRFYKSRPGKRAIDQVMLRLPIVSRVIKIAALVDTTRTLSILIGAGVSILEALDIITETTGNVVYQEAFVAIKHGVERGETLGNSLEAAHIFPPIFVQMTSVGESTGHLDETLGHLANYFESESEIAIKALTTLIEPAILVVLGLGVGFVVIAVITPIFSLSSQF
jgi:type IV pilus assembly protein PilC